MIDVYQNSKDQNLVIVFAVAGGLYRSVASWWSFFGLVLHRVSPKILSEEGFFILFSVK